MALTNNGTTLDAGTYTLNSFGYFEDLTVQLPGGSDSVKSAYAGDHSFNASSATSTITITPAASELNGPNVTSAAVGVGFMASALVQSLSTGVPPSGTVTFYVNGTPVTGTTTYQGGTQVGPPAVASLNANFTSSAGALPKPGNYSITASYSGDANYTPITSLGTSISVQYPNPVITFTPVTQTINPGNTATLTALLDTSNKTVYPTGTVNFVNTQGFSVLAGPLTCANAKDSSGNDACQVSASFTPNASIGVTAQYLGDANYPATDGGTAQVVLNDFTIGMDSSSIVTVVQGQSQTARIDIGDSGNFNGTVGNFACSGLPAETSCSFAPTQVTGQGQTTLTITTTPPGQSRQIRRAANETLPMNWLKLAMLPLLGVCFLGVASRRRTMASGVMVFILLVMTPSCGGGGSGGGGQQNNPVPAIASLSPTQQAVGSQSQTLTINGSNFMPASTVAYNGTEHSATYVSSSQLTIPLSAGDMATKGSYPVVVTNPSPGGGVSNSMDFNVTTGTPTGTFTVTVGASSGSLSHTTTFTLIVQPSS